jgi:phage shock protein PspC (stress-responsive transcriptional regulator)
MTEDLERLAELRRRGALNDDEFALAKARILYGEETVSSSTPTPAPAPEPVPVPAPQPSGWQGLQRVRRSSQDEWIGGVCGGLGEHTPVPSWMWRIAFSAGALAWGVGLIPYVLLWIFMPEPLPEAEKVHA